MRVEFKREGDRFVYVCVCKKTHNIDLYALAQLAQGHDMTTQCRNSGSENELILSASKFKKTFALRQEK